MEPKLSITPKTDFIEYNKRLRKWSGIVWVATLSIIVIVIVLYLTFLRKLQLFEGTFVPVVLDHIKTHIVGQSPLGLFYICFFGGLFFLFVPIDVFYAAILSTGRLTPLHILLMFIGLLFSYSLNYLIGLRLARLSKKIISPKKFYKTKIIVNRFGKLAILFFNIIGIGSQQLTFLLGVFRYNKTRVFIFTVLGQIIRFSLVTIGITKIFGL